MESSSFRGSIPSKIPTRYALTRDLFFPISRRKSEVFRTSGMFHAAASAGWKLSGAQKFKAISSRLSPLKNNARIGHAPSCRNLAEMSSVLVVWLSI